MKGCGKPQRVNLHLKHRGGRERRFCKCLSRLEFFRVSVSICRKNTITPKGVAHPDHDRPARERWGS